jgi:WD40 repeat protein
VLAQRRAVHGAVYAAGYTDDGRDIVVAQPDGAVQLVDAESLRASAPPVQLPETALDMAVSPRGRLAFVTTGGTQSRPYFFLPSTRWYLVDLDQGQVVASGSLGLRNATLSAFSPDGRRVGVGGAGGQFVVVDLATGDVTRPRAPTEKGTIFWVTASPDGDRFATGSDAGDVNLWDSTTGALVGTARVPGELTAVPAFRADGTLNIESLTGRVYRWDPGLDSAIEFACRAAGRDLSPEEWSDAFPGRPWRPVCPE